MLPKLLIFYIQALFIPGLIVSLIRKNIKINQIIIISLLINFFIILLLSSINFYTLTTIKFLFFIEILIVILLSSIFEKKLFFKLSFIDIIYLIIFFYVIFYILKYDHYVFLSQFSEGDILLSWDNWALKWAGYSFSPDRLIPQDLILNSNNAWAYYNQIIPIIWSLFYKILPYWDLSGFIKLFQIFLNFLILFTIFFSIKRNKLFFLIFFVLLAKFYFFAGFHIYTGMIDPTVASFAFLTFFYSSNFLCPKKITTKDRYIYIVIFSILTVFMKLSALYFCIFFVPNNRL